VDVKYPQPVQGPDKEGSLSQNKVHVMDWIRGFERKLELWKFFYYGPQILLMSE
jgi:hypothetical protein